MTTATTTSLHARLCIECSQQNDSLIHKLTRCRQAIATYRTSSSQFFRPHLDQLYQLYHQVLIVEPIWALVGETQMALDLLVEIKTWATFMANMVLDDSDPHLAGDADRLAEYASGAIRRIE